MQNQRRLRTGPSIPTIHHDLTARHRWLKEWAEANAAKLSGDPHFYDVKAAGWWVWGRSIWIGTGWGVSVGDRIPQASAALYSQIVLNKQECLS